MSARCYDQDGNENPDLLACSADGNGLASCCQPGDACATNGFCLPPSAAKAPLNYYVYGCSDPTWNASTCVNECNLVIGTGVIPCGESKFCCYLADGCDCSNSTAVFSRSPVRIATTLPASTALSSAVSTTPSIRSSPSPDSKSDAKSSGNVGLGVGLGVGIPVGFAVAGLFWVLNQRAKRRQAAEARNVEARTSSVDEVDNTNPHELETLERPQELSTRMLIAS
ncbi:hypothetical protein BKA56DRAFT_197646 [Ilyonectria sp. MPI-CAGE-AT-0026]|nr:hypothetical protein BKA56DRAFT_197646 [Ilyonectria sp. MPI-CAGE-AT-0026]